jgi:hypothetical protein
MPGVPIPPPPPATPADREESRHWQTICLGILGVGVTLGGIAGAIAVSSEIDAAYRSIGIIAGGVIVAWGLVAAIGLLRVTGETDLAEQLRIARKSTGNALLAVIGGVVLAYGATGLGLVLLSPEKQSPRLTCDALQHTDPVKLAKARRLRCLDLD